MKYLLIVIIFIFLTGCATNGTSNIDPTLWDDLLNISKALNEGKSYSEALGEVKY